MLIVMVNLNYFVTQSERSRDQNLVETHYLRTPVLIILPANSMTTQLQKLWIFYYMPTHYSSVLFRSLHYYTLGLIIRTRN